MTTKRISKTAVYNGIKTLNVDNGYSKKSTYVHQYNYVDKHNRSWEFESMNKELRIWKNNNYNSVIIQKDVADKKDVAKRISDFINSL